MPLCIRGFVRPDGSVGTRNNLLVVSMSDLSNEIAQKIGRAVPSSVALLTPAGSLSFGEEARLVSGLRSRLCANPNVGAILVVGPIETENAAVAAEARTLGRLAGAVSLLDHIDGQGAVRAGIHVSRHLRRELASTRRCEVAIDALRLGLKSSVSNAESVRYANPAVGSLVDLVSSRGAGVCITELADLCGDPAAVIERAATRKAAREIYAALRAPLRLMHQLGPDVPDPTPMNVMGGIVTIARKSQGALKRLGRSPIKSVIRFGEQVPGGGSHLMAGPASCALSLMGLAAAGCTVIVHTVGLTGATASSPLVPMIKIGGPSLRASRDVDLFLDNRNARAGQLADITFKVASGTRTASERSGECTIMLPNSLPPL